MPVVKKIEVYIDDIETLIKVSVDSNGIFSANIPLHVKAATHRTCTNFSTMKDAVDEVYSIINEYKELSTTKKWVILIDFKRRNAPFMNDGVSLNFCYTLVEKEEYGRTIRYNVIHEHMDGEMCVTSNNIRIDPFNSNKGVVPGQSLEIDYTPETLATLKYIESQLNLLSDKLSEICKTKEGFLQIVDGSVKLLSNYERY